MDMTFREKSILGSLVVTLALFGYYFFTVFQVVAAGSLETLANLPMLAVSVVVVLISVEAAYHAAIALHNKPEKPDERDRLIEARATRIAYFVLVSGCFLAVGHLMFSGFFVPAGAEDILATPVMSANLVLLFVILAETAGFAMQLFYYRRGL